MAKVISQLPSGGSVPKHNNLLGLNEGDYLHLTQFEKAKLDGIQSGAEVNVNTDWNAVSGDAQLLNKPTSFPPSTHTHTKSQITDFAHTHPISDVTGLPMALDDLQLNKEDKANKSTSIFVDYLSNIKFPSVKAVYDFCMSAFKKKFLDFGDVTGIAHTFGVGSENTMYKFSNNNPITATIPTNATTPFEIGTVFETIAIGNGALTVTGAPGVTILTNLSNTSVKNEVRRYTKIDIDTWTVEGEDSNTLKLTGNQTFSGNKSASQSSEVLTLTNTGVQNYIGILRIIANNGGAGISFNSSNGVGARFDLDGTSFGIRIYSTQTAKPIDIIHDSSADIINVKSGGLSLKFNINSAGDVKAKSYNISSLNTAPTSATATGTVGEIRVTSTHIYVCIANNTWVRAALTTW